MDYNILIGGEAGQGMDTLSSILEKILKRKGYNVFSTKDYMSRVRGGHNFIQIRFGSSRLMSHNNKIDVIIALNGETIKIHNKKLASKGCMIFDEEASLDNIEANADTSILKLPLKTAAKEVGNPKVMGSIALGALLKVFNLDMEYTKTIFGETFSRTDIIKDNIKAIKKGYEMVDGKYNPPSPGKDDSILINGNHAIAIGALAAGCRFYSAYPMTPSTSIMNYLASKMERAGIMVEQAEDEIAAINMAVGASYAGVRSMTGTSGGGFSLMAEGLGLAGMMEIPLVIAEIQRPGPVTGLPTRTEQSDLKFVINASQGEFPRMVIALRHPADAFYQTFRAFNLADKYRIPVILLGDQYLADYTTTIPMFDFESLEIKRYLNQDQIKEGKEYKTYELTNSGISRRIIPGSIPGAVVLVDSDEHDDTGHIIEDEETRRKMVEKRMKKQKLLEENDLLEPDFLGEDNFQTLLICWGSLYGPVKEALEMLNRKGRKKYGALVFGDIWPLPKKKLQKKAERAESIINVEQNATAQLASIIREQTGIVCKRSILKYDGRPFTPEEIADELKDEGENNE